MRRDGLQFVDPIGGQEVIFNYYTLGELVKGCLVRYGNLSVQEAETCLEKYDLLNREIDSIHSVYLLGHEEAYHWAMIALHGKMYWTKYPGLDKWLQDYNEWQDNFIKEHNLQSAVLVTIPSASVTDNTPTLSASDITVSIDILSKTIQEQYNRLTGSMDFATKVSVLYEQNQEQLLQVQQTLVDFFQDSTAEGRQAIWDYFEVHCINSRLTMSLLRGEYSFTTTEGLKRTLLLIISQNCFPDPRDIITELGFLSDRAKRLKINYSKACIELAPLASNEDWSGMGSLQGYLIESGLSPEPVHSFQHI